MIVGKAVKMAGMMNVPVIGLVENMSYLKCPDCGKEIRSLAKAASRRRRLNSESGCWAEYRSIRRSPVRRTKGRSRRSRGNGSQKRLSKWKNYE